MKMYKYICNECDMDFWTDLPEANYCCNCGNPKLTEETEHSQDELIYLMGCCKQTCIS